MDSESAIFILMMVLACIIPIAIINKKKKNKERQFLQTLFDLAEKNNCKITDHDRWGNTAIGIDQKAGKLFFIRKTSDGDSSKEVDLYEVKKCRFVNTSRIVNLKESNQKVIEKLELVFTLSDPKKSEIILEFYNSIYDSLSLRGEIQLGEKWSEIVNAKISKLVTNK